MIRRAHFFCSTQHFHNRPARGTKATSPPFKILMYLNEAKQFALIALQHGLFMGASRAFHPHTRPFSRIELSQSGAFICIYAHHADFHSVGIRKKLMRERGKQPNAARRARANYKISFHHWRSRGRSVHICGAHSTIRASE
jgi:hypothetical protein